MIPRRYQPRKPGAYVYMANHGHATQADYTRQVIGVQTSTDL